MPQTENLRRQHDALQSLSDELLSEAMQIETIEHARDCVKRLGKMAGVLSQHLAAEDNSLYPQMMASPDREVADLARAFAEEMGGLALTFQEFVGKWSSPSTILGSPSDFRAEAAIVLFALEKRIKRENDDLYPLAYRLGALGNRAA